jgi:aryl sulfotransferase
MMPNTQKTAQFVWLASYPRSGNTWLRIMLNSLRNGGEAVDINHSLDASTLSRTDFEQHFGVESSDLTQDEIDAVRPELHRVIARESKDELIFRKVHDTYWSTALGEPVFSPGVSRGAIYIVRDPRDVAVSAAHHFNVELDESIRLLGDGARALLRKPTRLNSYLWQPLGTWSEHVASWLDDADMPVLLVRYEDMLADCVGELARVVDFLGLSGEVSPATVARIAEQHSFTALRKQEEERGFREKPPGAERFFRQGRSGEGREVLTLVQLDRIEADHGNIMRRLGYLR